MKKYSGFLIKFDEPKRASLLQECIEGDLDFSENLSAPDWATKVAEIYFLCFEGEEINYAALAIRGAKSATAKYRVAFSHFIKFNPPILPKEIKPILGGQYSEYLIKSTSGGGGRIPTGTWQKLIEAIEKLRPDKQIELKKLFDLRLEQYQSQGGPGFEIMALEKDAVGLVLDISGLDRRNILAKQYQVSDKPAPFLTGLKQTNVLEDAMIFNDMKVFGNWRELGGTPVGMATFKDNGKRVTIVNTNRTPLEKTLGVDLIYYHSQFNSFVMVQYKRMENESGDWVYRPDEQLLDKEMKRMRLFEAGSSHSIQTPGVFDYRLHPGLFYLKLCQEKVFTPNTPKLIKGMYLPIDYFDILKLSTEMRGERQGLRVSWNNSTRYLNNTLFIALVKDGWIGARSVTSDTLTEIIRDSLEGKKSLILARETSISNQDAGEN